MGRGLLRAVCIVSRTGVSPVGVIMRKLEAYATGLDRRDACPTILLFVLTEDLSAAAGHDSRLGTPPQAGKSGLWTQDYGLRTFLRLLLTRMRLT